jgi:hypothetical protein
VQYRKSEMLQFLFAARGRQPADQPFCGSARRGPRRPGQPMIQYVTDAVERTHRLTGVPRQEVAEGWA